MNHMYILWCMPFVILLWGQYLFICNMQHESIIVEFVCVSCESSKLSLFSFAKRSFYCLPMYISLFYGQVAHKNIELLSRVITDNSQSNLQFHGCFSQTTSSFSTAESSQQLFHNSQLTAAFTESAAQPNTTLIHQHEAPR